MFSKYEGTADITLSRNMLGKSMSSIPLLLLHTNHVFYHKIYSPHHLTNVMKK